MTKLRSDKVALKGDFLKKEALADEIISPGQLVELTATGIRKQTRIGATVDTFVPVAVALDSDIVYSNTNGIDVDYLSGDITFYGVFPKGSEIQLKVPANAPAITKGVLLGSLGNGFVEVATVSNSQAIAVAIESVDNSAGITPAFINVEVL